MNEICIKINFKFQFYWMCSPIEMDFDFKVSFVIVRIYNCFYSERWCQIWNKPKMWLNITIVWLSILVGNNLRSRRSWQKCCNICHEFFCLSFKYFILSTNQIRTILSANKKKWNKQWRSMHIVEPNIKMNQEKILDNCL